MSSHLTNDLWLLITMVGLGYVYVVAARREIKYHAECKRARQDRYWRALAVAAQRVEESSPNWEGFSIQDAKLCIDAYEAKMREEI